MERDGLPIAVIAAAGCARRFNGEQKVLADVGGMPAVCRVARACEEGLGPHRQIVVVGHMAEQVRAALGEAPHREFVHQHPQLGTGHALTVALASLSGTHGSELYFLCGDKPLLTADSMRRLRARLRTSGAAMAFLTSELDGDPHGSRQGRVLLAHRGTPRAEALAIIERSAIDALDGRKLAFESFSGELWEYTQDQLLAIRDVNVSAYGWRLELLRKHAEELPQHPESGEYFITDLVEIMRRHRHLVRAFPVANGHESIGIDTQELLERAKEAWAELRRAAPVAAPRVRPVQGGDGRRGVRCSELLNALENGDARMHRLLAQTYGDAGLIEERRRAHCQAARHFLERWGDRTVRLFRAPGRIALNPHSEHQGAWVPYGTHRREIAMVVGPRRDDAFRIANVDPSHDRTISFRLGEEIGRAPDAWGRSWQDYIEDPRVMSRRDALADPKDRFVGRTGSINFVKAAALRLAREAPARPCGADIVINGDIPVGVGESSSSAVVVATAMALNELWDLKLTPRRLTSVCGEAEWYVGTRGGAGDHAAMLLGSPTGLMGICFEPPVAVRDVRPMPLPAGYQIIIANSGKRAIKNKEERRQFNAGIFAYRFALVYLKEALRKQAGELGLGPGQEEVRFLADINAERFSLEAIYRLLLAVPESVAPRELLLRYPESYEQGALSCFGTADPEELPQSIPVRGAALYGLGRVDRGLAMHSLCAQGDEAAMREFGRLMYITHDGDRVSRYDARGGRAFAYTQNLADLSDERVRSLIEAGSCEPGAPRWQAAQLRYQPGLYGASTPELDRIVDLVSPLPEVLGAGLMGAGGGGCVLVLARAGEESLGRVRATLLEGSYRPPGIPVTVEPWQPTAPAGELAFGRSAARHPSRAKELAEETAAGRSPA